MKYYSSGQAKEDALVMLILEKQIPGSMFFASDLSPCCASLIVDRALHHAMRVSVQARQASVCSCLVLHS